MERVAAVEVHDQGTSSIEYGPVARDVAVHRRGDVLLADAEAPHRRPVVLRRVVVVVPAGRDERRVDRLVPLERDERLRRRG